MRLRRLFPAAPADPEIAALHFDARRVEAGTLFFCVRGFTRDGHDFAPEAVARGAAALVVDHPLGLGVPEVVVGDVRAAMAPAAATFHGDPTARLAVAGITGTSGKTTTSFVLRHLLETVGRRTALLGTVKSVVAGREGALARTTPEAIELQAAFAQMADGGDEACVMEVSSHALELHRADAIHWAAAAFTNLSQDHLDFHPSMEAYFAAKRRLFVEGEPQVSIVCVDDEHGRRLAAELRELGRPPLTVATGAPADLRAERLELTPAGAGFTAVAADGARLNLRSPLPGRFNVANALVAVALARTLGVRDAAIEAALPDTPPVPGRLQPVDEGQPFTVLVDYSHKPGALEHVLRAARELAAGARVLVAFGAGGDRDRGKRPLMGEVAARLADEVAVTSDNPRSEDPEAIIAEILAGIGRSDVLVEPDRRAAIRALVARAGEGDVVVIAGKGDERGQELAGGVVVPFDDVEVAREAIRAAQAGGEDPGRVADADLAR
jgi:UDP-N-acetylmuramoyl-L-alanyl-D-glutamate--2,6-diaminopimelate ligase